MITMASKTKSKRIFYFDALRAVAILVVLIFHVYGCTNGMATREFVNGPTLNWFINCFFGSSRMGVDLFLMLSGALSLGRVWDIKSFLGKRLPRITAPFLFWGFLLCVLMFLSLIYVPDILSKFITPISSYSITGFLTYLYGVYMAINPGTSQYWFFWMILGTYLIMPVLNKWLLHSDLKEAEYFLFFWLIACIFESTLNIKFPIKLDYFAGTIGLVVLGYYLRHTERKLLNNAYFALVLTIAGFILSISAMYLQFTPGDLLTPTHDRLSIFIIIEVIGVFLLFKNFGKFNLKLDLIEKPVGIFKKAVFSLAKYSYGMYLNHIFIMLVLLHYAKMLFNSYLPFALFLIIGTVGISWLIMALLNRVPYLNQVIGAK